MGFTTDATFHDVFCAERCSDGSELLARGGKGQEIHCQLMPTVASVASGVGIGMEKGTTMASSGSRPCADRSAAFYRESAASLGSAGRSPVASSSTFFQPVTFTVKGRLLREARIQTMSLSKEPANG